MALLPEQKLQNVKASLFKYIESNYTATAVHFSGAPFKEEDHEEWVRVDLLVSANKYFRQVGVTEFGADLVLLLNMNIFLKRPKQETSGNTYRNVALRDLLFDLFKVSKNIPVLDYAGALAAAGGCITYDWDEHDVGLNTATQLYGYNISSTLFYLSKWNLS